MIWIDTVGSGRRYPPSIPAAIESTSVRMKAKRARKWTIFWLIMWIACMLFVRDAFTPTDVTMSAFPITTDPALRKTPTPAREGTLSEQRFHLVTVLLVDRSTAYNSGT